MDELKFVDWSIDEVVTYNHDQEPYRETIVSVYLDTGCSEDLVVTATLEQVQYFLNSVINY